MDFQLSNEQLDIQEMVRSFAEKEIAPFASVWDAECIFPIEVFKKAASLGLAALYVKSEVGGTGLTRLDSALIFEILATACVPTAAYLSIHNMVAWLIDTYANDALRHQWLPKLADMSVFSSYCLTEPSAGSDAASLKTTAKLEGSDYVINGSKAFISGGSVSDIYVCMVRTGENGANGISCILIEKGTPGLSFGKQESKMGWCNMPTTEVYFEQCRVPKENLIGLEGNGFKMALSALNGGRVNIAACSLGGARRCLQQTKQYLIDRKQFNQSLASFEALQFAYADMLTEFEASRLMVHRAAVSLDQKHRDAILHCAMAKRFATDLCFNICNQALQMHGGYGYIKDYEIERFVRDLRVHQILEGSNEIMRLIIARQALREDFSIE